MDRRRFLRHVAAGGAIATLPAVLTGCSAVSPLAAAPEPVDAPLLDVLGLESSSLSTSLSALMSRGADFADVYLQRRRTTTIVYEDDRITASDLIEARGAGLRAVSGDRSGYISTESLDDTSLLAAATSAATVANGGERVAARQFTPVDVDDFYPAPLAWFAVRDEQRNVLLERAVRFAQTVDASVQSVSAYWTDQHDDVLIATDTGRLVSDTRPLARLTLTVRAMRAAGERTGFATLSARAGIDWFTDARLEALAIEAVERTLALYDATRPPPGDVPVILAAGSGGVLLHEAVGHAFEGDLLASRLSPYAGRLGDGVAGEDVTLIDEPGIDFAHGAMNVDDEGEAPQRRVLVENGVLRDFLHDRVSAAADGLRAGSGRRDSYRFAPLPRMSCTYLASGPMTRDELIEATPRAVLCDSFETGTAALGSGDFRFRVKTGWLVENGRLTSRVRDFDLVGNGPSMLAAIDGVADDFAFDPGGWRCGKNGQFVPVSHGTPTVRVSKLKVL
jgi:TldD protein